MPEFLLLDSGCASLLQHPPLHLHIDFKVNGCGIDICMPQPLTDHVDVIPGAQQMHRSGMAKGMWGNSFSFDRRALVCGDDRVFADDIADSKARDRYAVGIQEQGLGCRLCGATLSEVVIECNDRLWP